MSGKTWLIRFLMPAGLLAASFRGQAQPDTSLPQNTLENIIEETVENTEQEFSYDTDLEYLENYRSEPLDLNSATREELAGLGLLTDQQILALLEYRRKYGALYSLYELQGVPHFNRETILKILPYVRVGEKKPGRPNLKWRNLLKYGHHDIFLRTKADLIRRNGFTMPVDSGGFYGRPFALYARYKYRYGKWLEAGFTTETDAGEPFRVYNRFRPDFLSAHAFYRGKGMLRVVALGDYSVQLGQGLVSWTGFGYGKSSEVLATRKSGPVLHPYASSEENKFFRGLATDWRLNRVEAMFFLSCHKTDARLEPIPDDVDPALPVYATSLVESGLHRTASELKNRDLLTLNSGGMHLAWHGEHADLGINALYTQLFPAIKPGEEPYELYDFSGNQLLNASVDYTWSFRNLLFFGETAVSRHRMTAAATLNGLQVSLDSRTSVSLLYRYYAPGYYSFFSNAFAEGSEAQNESGLYLGLEHRLSGNWLIKGFLDWYRSPWLKYQADAPSSGREWFLQAEYMAGWNMKFYLRLRGERKWKNKPGDTLPIDHLTEQIRHSLRLNLEFALNPEFKLRSRLEWSRYRIAQENPEYGFLIYQDIIWRSQAYPVSLYGRLSWFDIDSYNTRVYTYENDLLYTFSVPSFSGKGGRIYAMLKYSPVRQVDCWLKGGLTWYMNRETIGSGADEIPGNRKPELKFQVRFRF